MKKKSLFFRYFISSIFINLFVVIIFGVVFYHFGVSSIHSEVNASQLSAVAQALNKTDYLIESMSNIAYHFSSAENEGRVGNILQKAHTPAEEGAVCSQLLSYEENLAISARVGLFVRGEPFMYLSDGKHTYNDFERTYSGDADFTMSRLFSAVNASLKPIAVRLMAHGGYPRKDSPAIAFIFPIPQMNILPSASLLFLINESEYLAMLDNYSGEAHKNAYLIDRTLQVVYQSEADPLHEDDLLSLIRMKGTGVFQTQINRKPMVVMRALSNNSGYSLVVLMAEDSFYSRVGLMRRVVLICMLCFVGLSLLLALITAITNYEPIKKLLGNMGVDSQSGLRFKSNEMEVILDQFELSNQKNVELSRLIDMQRPYVLFRCIQNILKGKTGEEDQLAFEMQCANLVFTFPLYQVMLVTPLGGEETGKRNETILRMLDGFAGADVKLYAAELYFEKRVAVILNYKNLLTADSPTALSLAAQIAGQLKQKADLEVSIAIGNSRETLDEVHTSFVEALVVANEFTSGIHCFETETDGGSVHYNAREMEQAMLYHAIEQGDSEVALRTLESMVAQIRENGSMLIMQYQCFDIANMLIKTAGQMAYAILHADLQLLGDPKDMDRFLETAKRLSASLCRHSAERKEQQRNLLDTEIIRYVNQEFRSNDLSLEQTAAHFDLSVSHLSRLFKQITGRTFVQYVTQLRMDAIKEALAATDHQIKDIVTGAGYIDVASFVRKFRTLEGMTPGQYRQVHKRT